MRGSLQSRQIAVTRSDLRRLAALFVPAAVYVGAIPLIGMYVASGGYMLGTLAVQNRISVLRSLVIAVATSLALYLVFERMFKVSLPSGALGDLIGF